MKIFDAGCTDAIANATTKKDLNRITLLELLKRARETVDLIHTELARQNGINNAKRDKRNATRRRKRRQG
jgi:hypothetical protein